MNNYHPQLYYGDKTDKQIILPINSQLSSGGNIHIRGVMDAGKTALGVLIYKYLILSGQYKPNECVGNLTIKGKIGIDSGYQVLKGDKLHEWLWNCTHIPYRHRICFIDEIDSEFPAREFQSKEQTQIALRMWHNRKLRNYVIMTSHLGNSTDLIFHLSSNFILLPQGVDFYNNRIPFTLINCFDMEISDMEAFGVNEVITQYDRWEMTELTEEDSQKTRPIRKINRPSTTVIKRDGLEKSKRILKELL